MLALPKGDQEPAVVDEESATTEGDSNVPLEVLGARKAELEQRLAQHPRKQETNGFELQLLQMQDDYLALQLDFLSMGEYAAGIARV